MICTTKLLQLNQLLLNSLKTKKPYLLSNVYKYACTNFSYNKPVTSCWKKKKEIHTWSESLTVIFKPLKNSPSGGCSYIVNSNTFCGPFSPKNVGGWLFRSTTRMVTVVTAKSKRFASGLTSKAWEKEDFVNYYYYKIH